MSIETPDAQKRLLRIAGIIAALGAFLGMCGDYFLLYTPLGGYENGDYAFFLGISYKSLLLGHYLGVLAIPLQAAGIYLVYHGLQPLGQWFARGAAAVGVYLIFVGVAYHGALYPMHKAMWESMEVGNVELIETFRPFNEPLAAAFAIGFFVLMLGLVITFLRGGTRFPKWVVFVTPVATYPIWVLAYFVWPSVGNFLLPAGFNLSMLIFFSAILFAWRKGTQP